eukprot:gnl/MRDRNA2_/MRDRNA2_36108_c0_seq1.p1 gnl/MRDRNA2_/MRDRNA2_36108_c0~~gnl/MRDRNA2_/MRDRNA2_36108_c0_seq1.p1  ORF type:complete len:628 (+),score=104.97 gnl/MRDRNA2_/MRDRNA2_36108_c0_seq1:72-1955(+)
MVALTHDVVLRSFAAQVAKVTRVHQRQLEKRDGKGAGKSLFSLADHLVNLALKPDSCQDDMTFPLIAVPADVADRVPDVAVSMHYHLQHCRELGFPVHTASRAAALVGDKVALQAHRKANVRKHVFDDCVACTCIAEVPQQPPMRFCGEVQVETQLQQLELKLLDECNEERDVSVAAVECPEPESPHGGDYPIVVGKLAFDGDASHMENKCDDIEIFLARLDRTGDVTPRAACAYVHCGEEAHDAQSDPGGIQGDALPLQFFIGSDVESCEIDNPCSSTPEEYPSWENVVVEPFDFCGRAAATDPVMVAPSFAGWPSTVSILEHLPKVQPCRAHQDAMVFDLVDSDLCSARSSDTGTDVDSVVQRVADGLQPTSVDLAEVYSESFFDSGSDLESEHGLDELAVGDGIDGNSHFGNCASDVTSGTADFLAKTLVSVASSMITLRPHVNDDCISHLPFHGSAEGGVNYFGSTSSTDSTLRPDGRAAAWREERSFSSGPCSDDGYVSSDPSESDSHGCRNATSSLARRSSSSHRGQDTQKGRLHHDVHVLYEGCAGWHSCLANPKLRYLHDPGSAVGKLVLVHDPGHYLHEHVGEVRRCAWSRKYQMYAFDLGFKGMKKPCWYIASKLRL